MPLQVAPFLILALAAAIIGYGVWYQAQNPPRVVATGTLEVANANGARPERLTLDTRTVEIGTIRREEIQLPGGNWIDCAGDCRQAVRVALTHVFEEQQKRGK